MVWGRACPVGDDSQHSSKYMLTVELPSLLSISVTAVRKMRTDTRPEMVRSFQ
jgi:hypothetical protein